MATKTGSFDVNTLAHGSKLCFHQDGTIFAYFNYTITRESEKDNTVDLAVSYDASISGRYNYLLYFVIKAEDKSSGNVNLITFRYGASKGDIQTGTVYINNIKSEGSTINVTITGYCTSTTDCTWGSDESHSWTFNPEVPPYNPYTEPGLSINSYTQIGRIDNTNYNVNYTLTKGTLDIQKLKIVLLPYRGAGWNPVWEKSLDRNSSGTFNDSYQLNKSNGFTSGNRYGLKMYLYDGTTQILRPGSESITTDAYTVYTYQEPKISTSLSMSKTSLNANTSNTFSISGTNSRAWSSYENTFQTHYRIKRGSDNWSGWTNLGDITSWSRTASQMRDLVPSSYDGQDISIEFKRYSPSPQWYSTNTASGTFVVYYTPITPINVDNVTYRLDNSSGNIVSKNQLIQSTELSGIYVSWVYDTTSDKAGYVSGYRVRLYDKDKTLVKTYYTSNKYYTIPKSDIPKMQETYIDITPYYNNGSTDESKYWYQSDSITQMQFVRIVNILSTPVITYPVNNSNWINTDFRICFQLPDDDDYGYQDESTYHYEDIELQINGSFTIRLTDSNGHTTSGTNLIATQCFSSLPNDLTYHKKIVIYPKLALGFPASTSYKLKIRVKKKYFTSSSISGWSSWSNEITLKVTKPDYNVEVGDKILASHFNNTLTLVDRIRNTYGVPWSNKPETARSGITIIQTSQYYYSIMMQRFIDTKNQVNNYATYDSSRTNIKFDVTNQLPTNFTTYVGEKITAEANEDNEPNGRNYMKIIFDNCLYLQ